MVSDPKTEPSGPVSDSCPSKALANSGGWGGGRSPPLITRYLVESQIGYIQIQIQFGIHAAGRPATPAQGCAGWARNPKGPQITPFRHQMGRHPTIWDFKTGIRHRIPARISPWGSRGLNPNFFSPILDPKMPKSLFSGRVYKLLAPIAMDLGPQGPKGAQGAHRSPKGPLGPLGQSHSCACKCQCVMLRSTKKTYDGHNNSI